MVFFISSPFGLSVYLGEHGESLLVLSGHDEIARRFRHEAYQYGEQSGGNGLATEHVTPSGLYRPRVAAGHYGTHALAYRLDHGVGVVAEDEEVNHVDD